MEPLPGNAGPALLRLLPGDGHGAAGRECPLQTRVHHVPYGRWHHEHARAQGRVAGTKGTKGTKDTKDTKVWGYGEEIYMTDSEMVSLGEVYIPYRI